MSRQRLGVLVALVTVGGVVALFRVAAPDQYEVAVSDGQRLVSDLPDPVVVAIVWLAVVLVWIAAMILVAKLLYWGWRQIDDYVFRLWNLLLPQSPIVRFGVGMTLMIAFFVLGPLVVIQAVEITSEDPINDSQSDDDLPDETVADDGASNETDANQTAGDGTTGDGTANNGTTETSTHRQTNHLFTPTQEANVWTRPSGSNS